MYISNISFPDIQFELIPCRIGKTNIRKLSIRPRTKEELFNLRHSQLRNVVERIFGVLKRKFPILRAQPEYPMQSQVKIVLALTGLHNFIRKKSTQSEIAFASQQESDSQSCTLGKFFANLFYLYYKNYINKNEMTRY